MNFIREKHVIWDLNGSAVLLHPQCITGLVNVVCCDTRLPNRTSFSNVSYRDVQNLNFPFRFQSVG